MDILTPVYDLLSLAPYPQFDRACFMSIGVLAIEEGDEGHFSDAYNAFGYYTKHDFVQLGLNIGLPQTLVEKQMKQLTSKIVKALDNDFITPIPTDLYQQIVDRIRERCSALERTLD